MSVKTSPFLWLFQWRPPGSRQAAFGTGHWRLLGLAAVSSRYWMRGKVSLWGQKDCPRWESLFLPAKGTRGGKRGNNYPSCLISCTESLTVPIAGLTPVMGGQTEENLLFKYRGYYIGWINHVNCRLESGIPNSTSAFLTGTVRACMKLRIIHFLLKCWDCSLASFEVSEFFYPTNTNNHSAFLLGYSKHGEFRGCDVVPYKRTKQLSNLFLPVPFRYTYSVLSPEMHSPRSWFHSPNPRGCCCPWRCPLPCGHGPGGWLAICCAEGCCRVLASSHTSTGSISWQESRLFFPIHLRLETFRVLLDSARADL